MSIFNSDDPLSKFLFILCILIGFIVIMNISVSLLSMVLVNTKPYLIKGMVPGNVPVVIQQDPSISGAIPVMRSDNKSGIEFSWSVWLNITDVGNVDGQYQHIFHKGEQNISSDTGLNVPLNAPGLYVSPKTNELTVVMNTFDVINEEVVIPNFPMNKWANVIIRVMNNNILDVYVNGSLARRHVLSSLPRQNYGNVYVASNGGFTGNLSNLQYFTYAVQPGEIVSITNRGPSLTTSKSSSSLNAEPPYLSLHWYTDNLS